MDRSSQEREASSRPATEPRTSAWLLATGRTRSGASVCWTGSSTSLASREQQHWKPGWAGAFFESDGWSGGVSVATTRLDRYGFIVALPRKNATKSRRKNQDQAGGDGDKLVKEGVHDNALYAARPRKVWLCRFFRCDGRFGHPPPVVGFAVDQCRHRGVPGISCRCGHFATASPHGRTGPAESSRPFPSRASRQRGKASTGHAASPSPAGRDRRAGPGQPRPPDADR